MKYLFFIFLICNSFTNQTETMDIEVTVSNIKKLKGTIRLGIYNDPSVFLEIGKEYKGYAENATSETVVFVLKDLVKDDYAISLYHDVNSDDECNLNFFGIPTEPYGFSNNFKPKFSKPKFKDCLIKVEDKVSISIELID